MNPVKTNDCRIPRVSRFTHHASRITHHASRITHHASRITHHASRFTHHVSRITFHASLFSAALLFGLAFLMKQHGLFFGVFGAVYLLRVRVGEWLAAAGVKTQQPGFRSL